MRRNVWKEIVESFKQHKIQVIIMTLLIVATWSTIMYLRAQPQKLIQEISWSEFEELAENGEVDTVYYNQSEEYMMVTLLDDVTRDMTLDERKKFIERTHYKYAIENKRKLLYPGEGFRWECVTNDINVCLVQSSVTSGITNALFTITFYAILMGFMFRIMTMQMRGPTEEELIQTSDVTFDDIIGHEEIIDDVKFITELIKDPEKGDKLGAKLPKGILFSGPPGTGKTLLAKAIAHEADVPFLYQNASSFVEMYVGLGAKRVRSLFKIARKNAPCIVFIDEIDAVGGKRDGGKGNSETDQTINALLQEMDGFSARDGIFIIAATNRPDTLDEALVRSGRFDRQINVSAPRDWIVRKKLFNHYLSKFEISDDIDVDNVSKQVSGFTGADIAMVCNEASIIAVMKDKDAIDMACLEEAIDKKIFNGNRSKFNQHEDDRRIIAYHEAGHAVANLVLGERVSRASIQSTTSGVGGVVFQQDKDTVFMTDDDLRNQIIIAYAGRASEDIKFNKVTTGASNDITKATQLMLQYIEHLGFDKQFGLLDVSALSKDHLIDSNVITEKMSAMSVELYKECLDLLKKNYDKVEILAQKLLEVETLSGPEIEQLLGTK